MTQPASATGVRGVFFDAKRTNCFRARFNHNRRCVEVGQFATIAEAEAAIQEARRRLPPRQEPRKHNQFTKETPEQRFWKHAQPREGCWGWTGPTHKNGYANFQSGRRRYSAHRFSYMLHIGPIPKGLVLDHVKDRGCTRRDCVNPAHLEPVTHRVNLLRGNGCSARMARRTHCNHGHEFTPANTVFEEGHRRCRACRVRSSQRQRERKRAARELEGN